MTKGTKVTKGTNGTKGTDGAKVPNEAKGKKHRRNVKIDLDELIHESKEQFELLQAVYNALANAYLRNLEDRYEGDRWFVMCEGTDIITNELGDIISESDDIIAHAYEIACRDNFLMLFEDETGLTPQQLNALLRFEHPLAELYDDWIKRETSEMDNFRSSIECCANDAIRREKERKTRKKDVPER